MNAPATRRGRALEMLRAAGPVGVTDQQFVDAGVESPMAHLESLKLEGHVITRTLARDSQDRPVRRNTLVEDAWA